MSALATGISPRKPYLNLRWHMRDIEDMRTMYLTRRIDSVEIARRFSKCGPLLTSASEINEIIERNGWVR